MSTNGPSNPSPETPKPPAGQNITPAPAAERRVYLIAELLQRPDFPQSALGEEVDVGGFTGTLIEIVRHSIRVRPRQGATMGFNVNVLRKLYAPPPPEDLPTAELTEAPPPVPEQPPREFIEHPDFTAPPKPIEEFVGLAEFPRCVYGRHLDLHGFEGVVVEIVNRSLKIRSPQGSTRSYNADGLVKLYGKAKAPGR